VDPNVASVSTVSKLALTPAAEPIPGYRLIEPLGRGGFGEVWKCEAPGGLFKAIKFVSNDNEKTRLADREQQALQHIKIIRHPFILSLERVEVIDEVLVVVMELADRSLYHLFNEYQSGQLPGIPREELLGYLLEAAEALDWMNFGHNLQHLDIKPQNLFLVSNHVKVADFGLVNRLSETDVEKTLATQNQGGLTPLYVSPELLRGRISRHCDQYSLAIVYQQLLTGTLPFWCQNPYQLMLLHGTAQPNLLPLPPADRPIVARALAKRPDERFPSCMDFLQQLVCGESKDKPRLPRSSSVVRRLFSSGSPAAKNTSASSPPNREIADKTAVVPPSPSAETSPESSLETAENQVVTPQLRNVLEARRSLLYESENRGAEPESESNDVSPRQRLSLPGFKTLRCLNRFSLGEIWSVEDQKGRVRRALCLHDIVGKDAKVLARLKDFRHPILAPFDLYWTTSGRLVLVTEAFRQSMPERLRDCQKQGQPGIPRNELLFYLRSAAESLDALYQQYELPHLGLNPQSLVLHTEGVWILDYGITPLIWLPTGQPANAVGGRYAAPELFERLDLRGIPQGDNMYKALMGRAGSTADQYSLALIYTEMINGLPPRSNSTTAHRTSHRGSGASGLIALQAQERVDFDLLPSCDRIPLLKALHRDPEQRFPTCTALVDALEAAATNANRRSLLYHQLPTVIPFTSLQGEPPAEKLDLPTLNQLILGLAMSDASSPPRIVEGPRSIRYCMLEDDIWEFKFPVQLFSGALSLKVEGFRSEWRLQIIEQSSNRFQFLMQLPRSQPTAQAQEPVPPPGVLLELKVTSAFSSPKYFAEACVRVSPTGSERERVVRMLPNLAPRLFESIRGYMQAGNEQRGQERWACPQSLHVYPVRRDLEFEEILEGMSRNISFGGVSFRVSKNPNTEQLYLHWHKSPTASPFAVLARIVRAQQMVGGGFEVGCVFPQEMPTTNEFTMSLE
jgi:serine/threonine protein kinase